MWRHPSERRVAAELRLRRALRRIVHPKDRTVWTTEERLGSIERDIAWAKRIAYVLATVMLPILLEVFATFVPLLIELITRYAAR